MQEKIRLQGLRLKNYIVHVKKVGTKFCKLNEVQILQKKKRVRLNIILQKDLQEDHKSKKKKKTINSFFY